MTTTILTYHYNPQHHIHTYTRTGPRWPHPIHSVQSRYGRTPHDGHTTCSNAGMHEACCPRACIEYLVQGFYGGYVNTWICEYVNTWICEYGNWCLELWLSLYLSMPMCHVYRIEGWLLSYRVVHWRANAGLLLSYPTIYNITSINDTQHTNIHLHKTINTIIIYTTTTTTTNNNNNIHTHRYQEQRHRPPYQHGDLQRAPESGPRNLPAEVGFAGGCRTAKTGSV